MRKQGVNPILNVVFYPSNEFPKCFYKDLHLYYEVNKRHLIDIFGLKEFNKIKNVNGNIFNNRLTDEQLIEFDSIALASPHGFDVFIEYIYNEFVLNRCK